MHLGGAMTANRGWSLELCDGSCRSGPSSRRGAYPGDSKTFSHVRAGRAGAPTCSGMRGAAGCTARPSSRSRISARAKRALGKHPADVRFAGTSGSQAQCEGAQAPSHWTEWPCRQGLSDELGRTCPALLGGRRICGERLGSGHVDAGQQQRACEQACDDLHKISFEFRSCMHLPPERGLRHRRSR
jgi:hypothetical protein